MIWYPIELLGGKQGRLLYLHPNFINNTRSFSNFLLYLALREITLLEEALSKLPCTHIRFR